MISQLGFGLVAIVMVVAAFLVHAHRIVPVRAGARHSHR